MLPYFLSFLGGYLIGSFPTGYLLVKQKTNVDITRSGSGNAGAYNAGVVTGSKWIGISVGLIDGLKGVVAVLLGQYLLPGFLGGALGIFAAVIGHNYPLWLRFKGGRGLATACGGFVLLSGGYVLVWCTIWFVMKWQRQTILGSNLVATLATPVVLLPGRSLEAITVFQGDATSIRWLGLVLSLLLLLSHRDAWRELSPKKGG